jgi:hypothetical protein
MRLRVRFLPWVAAAGVCVGGGFVRAAEGPALPDGSVLAGETATPVVESAEVVVEDDACSACTKTVKRWRNVTEMRDVECTEWTTEERTRTYTVKKRVPRTEQRTRTYTVMVPEQRTKTVEYTVKTMVPETRTEEYQVKVPYTEEIEKTYTVMVPVKEERSTSWTVKVPYTEQVEQTYTGGPHRRQAGAGQDHQDGDLPGWPLGDRGQGDLGQRQV